MRRGGWLQARGREVAVTGALDALGLALVLLAVACVAREPFRIHHDAASLLTSSLCWVEGRAGLHEMAGMNLPLALYFYAVPAGAAHVLRADPVPVFSAFTLAVLLASLAACRRLLGEGAPGSPEARAFLRAVLCGLLLFTLEGPELTFGQREVFFLALVLPFVLVRWRRGEGAVPGPVASGLCGLGAALGGLLKPQLLLALLLVAVAPSAAGRPARFARTPETMAFGTACLAYALHFFLLPGAVREAFLAAVRGAAQGYRAYDAPLAQLLCRPAHLLLLVVAAAAVLAARKEDADPFARLAAAFAGLGLGGALVFFLQRKGFPYHLVPEVAGAGLSVAAIAGSGAMAGLRGSFAARARPFAGPARLLAVAGAAGAALLAVLAISRLPERLEPVPRSAFEVLLAERTLPGEEVLVFSTSVFPASPALLRMGRRPFGKWISPFMQIAFAHADDPKEAPPRYAARDRMRPSERRFLDELGKAVLEAPPRIVLVASRPPNQGLPTGFDLVEYLRAAGFLDGEMAGYARVAERAGYAVYRRQAPRPPRVGAAGREVGTGGVTTPSRASPRSSPSARAGSP